MVTNKITLLTGGARSGKSNQALKIVANAKQPGFIATAQALDEEMAARIAKHKAERSTDYQLIEEPIWIASAISNLAASCDYVLLDCLTLWLANLMGVTEKEATQALDEFEKLLQNPPCNLVVVTNEIGLGLVPETAMGREFRDKMGRLNQDVANYANQVIFMVSGQPLTVKNEE